MDYPSAYEVAETAKMTVLEIMKPVGRETGSDKSRPGEWYWKDVEQDPGYHHMRAIRHLTTAWNLNVGTEQGEETEVDHLKRAVVRSVFCLMVAQKGDSGA